MREFRERVHQSVGNVIHGQGMVIDGLLITLLAGGHILLEGVPGTAKTLAADAFARTLGVEFSRAQFTPDMLPTDLTGTMTLRAGELVFRPGPVFTNILLADEINRTPPKTQAALLEAMGEAGVTVDGTRHPLGPPFMVVATQNPIEYEGTYPLPEAQLDRFLMKVDVGYPSAEDELAVLRMDRDGVHPTAIDEVDTVTTADEILDLREKVSAIHVNDDVLSYVSAVIRATREQAAVELGASPRAGVHLLAAARSLAALSGREFVTPDDVSRVVKQVLGHRILLRPEAEMERYTPGDILTSVLKAVPVPR